MFCSSPLLTVCFTPKLEPIPLTAASMKLVEETRYLLILGLDRFHSTFRMCLSLSSFDAVVCHLKRMQYGITYFSYPRDIKTSPPIPLIRQDPTIAVLALPLLVVANPISGSCNTGGSMTCCDDTADGILGIIGLTCTSLSIIGDTSCASTQQTVCCNGNDFSGVNVANCSPVNVVVL